MKTAILVPRRAGIEDRDRLWAFCRPRWEQQFPDWPIIEGTHQRGPFNRSAALNAAAKQAPDADVFLLIDADVIADPEAVRSAVEVAHATERCVISHHERIMLNKAGTSKVLGGYDGPWRVRSMVANVYTDSVSCALAVPRAVWDEVGGFDERYENWGYEDSAFAIAAETLTGRTFLRLASELYHLHHAPSPGAAKDSPTRLANQARLARYQAAAGDPDAIRALLHDVAPPERVTGRIPRILHRTVPAETTVEVEAWWDQFRTLHPGWDLRTYREPIDPADWPLCGRLLASCTSGAQRAGLLRLEALVTYGGVYCDSDVEPFRSFEPLLHSPAFAAWEDETTVPDAVLGAEPHHPAFELALAKAMSCIEGGGDAYQSGPAVTTEVLPNRDDVLLLPPGAFYPHHYLEKSKANDPVGPWVFCRHMWAHSWGTPAQKASIEKRQR